MNEVTMRGDVVQFTPESLHCLEDSTTGFPWFFTCAMVSTCEPLLDDCEDNHDVAARLIREGVIKDDDDEDSEGCQMFVNFKTREQGLAFIDRLNEYLVRKHEALRAAREM